MQARSVVRGCSPGPILLVDLDMRCHRRRDGASRFCELIQKYYNTPNHARPAHRRGHTPREHTRLAAGREGARARGREGAWALPWLVGWPLTRSLTHSLG